MGPLFLAVPILALIIFPTASPAVGSPAVTASSPAVGFSAEPRLVTEGAVELPLQLLIKRGVNGVVTVDVDINQQGEVEQCVVRSGVDPLLDSLICISMKRSLFTPAYTEGKAVASTIAISYTFDLASILHGSGEAVPEIHGIVLEKRTALPVKNAKVNLEIVDSLVDKDVKISMSSYLRMIGSVPGQTEKSGILSTFTDSLGCFAFRLLPSCPVRLAIMAPHFEIAHAAIDVKDGASKKVTCHLEQTEKDSATEIVVYGTPHHEQRLDIEEVQVATGLTHYLSSMLQTKATVRSVPESRSVMMVRAGSPFDNRYYICGVPFLAPYHFGGHSYADFDGMMISALSEVDLTIDRIAGRRLDASGFYLDAQPGINRPANRQLLRRPELSVDLNNSGQDFLLSLPRRKTDDCLQLGFTRADRHTLRFLDSRRALEDNEYGNPAGYGNVTLTGSATLKSLQLNSFSWLAWDTYAFGQNERQTIPWGMAGITARSENPNVPEIRAGGSHQYFASGRRFGSSLYRNDITMSNGDLSFAFDHLLHGFVDASLELTTEYMQWDGSAERIYQVCSDTIEKKVNPVVFLTPVTYYVWKDTASAELQHASGKEYSLQMHGAVNKTFGPFTASVDLLGVGLLYGKTPDAIGDAGVSIEWQGKNIRTGLHGGRITSRPDIRGLPDSLYRRVHSGTWLFSLPTSFRFGPDIKFGIQPYVRRKNNEPKADLILRTWMPGESTPLLAAGVDIDAELQLLSWLAINSAANFSRAKRSSPEGESTYEWDVPWGNRTGIHLKFGKVNQLHIYGNGVVSKGLPVEKVDNTDLVRLPDYRRIDVSIQYRSRFIDHRFLTRYDAYFNVYNITDRFNTTDYYRDESMVMHPIPLGEMFCEIGVRLGLRG